MTKEAGKTQTPGTQSSNVNMSNCLPGVHSQRPANHHYQGHHNLSVPSEMFTGEGLHSVTAYLGATAVMKCTDDLDEWQQRVQQCPVDLNSSREEEHIDVYSVRAGLAQHSHLEPGKEQSDTPGQLDAGASAESQLQDISVEDSADKRGPCADTPLSAAVVTDGSMLTEILPGKGTCPTPDNAPSVSDRPVPSSSLVMESTHKGSLKTSPPLIPTSTLRPRQWQPAPLSPQRLSPSSTSSPPALKKPLKFQPVMGSGTRLSSSSDKAPSLSPTSPGSINTRSLVSSSPKKKRSETEPFTIEVARSLLGLGLDVKVTEEGVMVTRVQALGPVARDGNIK